jgi:hypothetical protein
MFEESKVVTKGAHTLSRTVNGYVISVKLPGGTVEIVEDLVSVSEKEAVASFNEIVAMNAVALVENDWVGCREKASGTQLRLSFVPCSFDYNEDTEQPEFDTIEDAVEFLKGYQAFKNTRSRLERKTKIAALLDQIEARRCAVICYDLDTGMTVSRGDTSVFFPSAKKGT